LPALNDFFEWDVIGFHKTMIFNELNEYLVSNDGAPDATSGLNVPQLTGTEKDTQNFL
jgi:hypothetical protein